MNDGRDDDGNDETRDLDYDYYVAGRDRQGGCGGGRVACQQVCWPHSHHSPHWTRRVTSGLGSGSHFREQFGTVESHSDHDGCVDYFHKLQCKLQVPGIDLRKN